MALTYDDLASGYVWKAKHLDEMLCGESIIDTGTDTAYNLFDHGALAMADIYDSLVTRYDGLDGHLEVARDKFVPSYGRLHFEFDENPGRLFDGWHVRNNANYGVLSPNDYLIPEESIEAFRDEISFYREKLPKIMESFPISLDDGTVIDQVRVCDYLGVSRESELIYESILAFSSEYPRDRYSEKQSQNVFEMYGEYGETGYYDISVNAAGLIYGGVVALKYSNMLMLMRDLDQTSHQRQNALIPELADSVDGAQAKPSDVTFNF